MCALIVVDEETLAQLQTTIKTLKKDAELAELLLNKIMQSTRQAKEILTSE